MKVIILNGYSNTEAGKAAFKKFLAIVKKTFDYSRNCGMDAPDFVVLNQTSISQYIYVKNTKYDNPEAIRLFDSIDFLMIDGDANLLPWTPIGYKFGMLFKQAKKCNKAIFAAGFGFYMLIYYCATNFLKAKDRKSVV